MPISAQPIDAVQSRLRSRGPWVEVDLAVLTENIHRIRLAATPGTQLVFVVKSDAYGHGLQPVVRAAVEAGVQWFAVAYLDEAVLVREAAPDARIVVMGVVDPAYVDILIEKRIIPVVVSEEHGQALGAAAFELDAALTVHAKIDSGMGRLGIPWQEAEKVISRLRLVPGLRLEGLCSHFAAVEPERPELAGRQVERLQRIPSFTRPGLFRHVSSSRGFLYEQAWDFEGVRVGIGLFGYGTHEEGMRAHTDPVLSWKTQVIQVRSVPEDFPVGYYSAYRTTAPTRLGVISVGYADGFPRLLSNKGHVLIGGKRCRVVGRVSMNWVTVDLGPDSTVQAGDEAVLIGSQGSERITATEIASTCHTIAYEVLTSIAAGNERRYLPAGP